jgi:sterol desaturase/sphingolipid hydroxylase (fatty acid hydroxylase superfamily)
MDFGEYLFHLAQHKIPILWSLHSLHHSDRSLNTSTTLRHFWGDQLLKAVTIYSVAGLLLRPNPVIVVAYSVISYYNFFSHMNVKIGLGRFSWLINSPQYHRLHHSIRRHDYDLRYAALFPIFDILCGTYRAPKKGDFPHTGLAEISEPDSVLEAIIWPVRRRENTLRAIEK